MTGLLRLKSLSDTVSPEDGTRILVTRWQPRHKKPWWDEWLPDLAPGAILLRDAKYWQRSRGDDTAWAYYRPIYIRQMQYLAPQAAIRALRRRLAHGETMTLLCYCKDERYCHRSLLRDLILEVKP